ncbi:MAG TPA: ATP-binding protein [Steroidobacteraceae bacterium]|jgi:signal transduction histidine kinase/HAMP domain-containing protein|nr:ATP-binding protein [Steroidobacteraceae bacterium]
MDRLEPILREWVASLRRLVQGPATLERTLVLTLGGLVLASILVLAFSAVGLLRQQAEQQALASVKLGGISAREEIRRMSEDALTATRLLADRPTLQRLIRSGNRAQLELFLRRACGTLSISACAVTTGPNVLASTRQGVQWTEALEAVADQGERFLLAPTWQPDGLLGAVASVPNFVETRVVALRYFDDRLAKQLSDQSGMVVRLVRLSNWLDNVHADYKELHSTALSRTESVARRIEARHVFASSTPIFASTGEGVVLLEARLPTSESDEVVAGFVRRLTWIAVLLALGAVAGALVLARRLGQPLEILADSATRLGRGDFSASIPIAGGGPEVVALARTLEDMRRNLVELTATLRRREADAQALLRGVVEGVYAVDADRNVRYMNPQAEKMLATNAQAALGRFCGDVLKPCPSEQGVRPCETACPIVAARERGQAQSTEFLQRADGSKRTVVITSAGPVDGLQVQVMRDETDLEAVRRARDSILANISHEFRTPLAAQLASIELLQENLEEMPREQIEELVTSLRRGSLRLTRLIDNLLESVRIESGQLSIRQQDLHLPEVIHDAVEMVGSLFTQRGQALHVDVPDDLPPIVGDGPRLVQVFVNLLANANKFGPDGSVVRIAARAEGEELVATVDDAGAGVLETERGSIFERFYRSADQEPEPRGLGLGLWIVKSIVERHGGRVGATRTEDGLTRLVVALPIAPRTSGA